MSTRASQYAARVERRDELSPHLVRLTLTVDPSFESTGIADEWVGLVVPGQFQSRYYTVRSYAAGTLVLDVVLHDVGLVTEWVVRDDCVGSPVTITEPKGSFDPPPDAAWLMLVGDLTGLPAMARIAESVDLPTRIWAEVTDSLPGYLPDSADVTWLEAPSATSRLAEVVESIEWPAGDGYFWMAGESAQMRAIRKYLMRDREAAGHGVRRDGLLALVGRPAATSRRPGADLARRQGPGALRRGDLGPVRRGAVMSEGYRSGFASFVGRPNAGKSTLTNALVGQKVVITSDKPQTTRTVVRGIVHRPDGQLVLVDTPGLHRPRTLLGERLNDLVRTTWSEVDVVAVCFPSDEKVGPGDRFIVTEMSKVRRTTKVAVATKTDLATPERIGEHLLDIQRLGQETGTEWAEIVPVSAVAGDQVQLLADLLLGMLPEGPQLYPDGDLTDAPEEILVAELIREAALEGVRDELPHSIAVVVEEMLRREDRPEDRPLLDIHANLYVERDSQKGIVIGHKGARLKDVGMRARKSIEAMLGTPVYLDLHVKIAKDWQRDPRQLRKLGF